MTGIDIETCTSLPGREALEPLLLDYYETVVTRMGEAGFPVDPEAPRSANAEFWDRADEYLPPEGCLVVARRTDGRLVGCGMMRRLDARTGELKRDYVAPEARGRGLGRALVAARETAAREMGLTRLVADTLTTNVEMRALYPKLGFRLLDAPIETTTYLGQPTVRPHLHFYAKEL